MKLSKAQAFLLSRIANGEIIQRNGQGKFDTWYSTDIHGLHVNYETAKILLSCGAVEEREIREGKFYRRFQLVIPNNIDYSADADSGDASRITPDPAGETADDGRPVDVHDYYPHADLLKDVAELLTTRPKVFTAFRHYSDDPIDFGGRFGHWSVWLQGWKDEPEGESILSTDSLFHTKRETMDWCAKHFPGVPVLYTTEARRK